MENLKFLAKIIILLCAYSLNSFGVGLGDIKVFSCLDQPFNAEISLIGVANTPIGGIQAKLASAEDYGRLGLEHIYALNLLSFNIQKNIKGKTVIKLWSDARIAEPYMPLLIDLAWSNGQVYRFYPILLDPPSYKLNVLKKQLSSLLKSSPQFSKDSSVAAEPQHLDMALPPVDVMRSNTTINYGPTMPNESIWSIAQRYRPANISLQQMILAIVAANVHAFSDKNLNGLKNNSYLQIPVNAVPKISPENARIEVLSQDRAWQLHLAGDSSHVKAYAGALAHQNAVSSMPAIPPLIINNELASHLVPLDSIQYRFENPQHTAASVASNELKKINVLELENKHLMQELQKTKLALNNLHANVERLLSPPLRQQLLLWLWLIIIIGSISAKLIYKRKPD